MKKEKSPLLAIFLVVLFAYIGISMPLPLFTPMLLYPEGGILGPGYSEEVRTIILGVVLSLYPLGQFLASPILGQLSDRYGRKKILTLSLIGATVGFALTALSIREGSLLFLCLSRLFCGICEANVVIVQSAAADLFTGRAKTRAFSLITMAASCGFIIGPLLGGKLSDPVLSSWFNYATPFWLSAGFALITFFYVWLRFPHFAPTNGDRGTLSPFQGILNLKKSIADPKMKGLFAASFLFWLSNFFFLQFLPLYQVQRFSFTGSQVADTQAYLAVIIALSQVLITTYLAKRVSIFKGLVASGFLMAFSLLFFALPFPPDGLFILLPFVGISCGIIMTKSGLLISNAAPPERQGEVMGINGSLMVAGEALSTLIGGVLAGIAAALPFVSGALITLGAVIILLFNRKRFPNA